MEFGKKKKGDVGRYTNKSGIYTLVQAGMNLDPMNRRRPGQIFEFTFDLRIGEGGCLHYTFLPFSRLRPFLGIHDDTIQPLIPTAVVLVHFWCLCEASWLEEEIKGNWRGRGDGRRAGDTSS